MKEIVQLTKEEYGKLQEAANYNQDEIVKLAEEMYQKNGTFKIKLTIDCQSDYLETIDFKVYSYITETGELERFSIPYNDRREIVKFVDEKMLDLMQREFGRQITNINLWNKRFDLLRNWKLKFIGLTIFGWLAAFAILVISILR